MSVLPFQWQILFIIRMTGSEPGLHGLFIFRMTGSGLLFKVVPYLLLVLYARSANMSISTKNNFSYKSGKWKRLGSHPQTGNSPGTFTAVSSQRMSPCSI